MGGRIGFLVRLGVAGIAVLLLISCGPRNVENLAERTIERAAARAGEDVDINLSGDTVSITDRDGNSFTVGAAELPKGWPDSVPFKPDLEIMMAGSAQEGGNDTWTVTAAYSGPAKEVYDYYRNALSAWEVSADSLMESEGVKNYTFQAANDTYEMGLFLADEDGSTTVIIGLSRQ